MSLEKELRISYFLIDQYKLMLSLVFQVLWGYGDKGLFKIKHKFLKFIIILYKAFSLFIISLYYFFNINVNLNILKIVAYKIKIKLINFKKIFMEMGIRDYPLSLYNLF